VLGICSSPWSEVVELRAGEDLLAVVVLSLDETSLEGAVTSDTLLRVVTLLVSCDSERLGGDVEVLPSSALDGVALTRLDAE
jgi:hypothetical protein